jgi:hypothetical protein
MGLKHSQYFVISYRPLILAYAGGPETALDPEILRHNGERVIMLQFMSWWAGNEASMRRYREYQQRLEAQGIEHHLMVNAPDEEEMRQKLGVRGALCSKNLFCDEHVFDLFDADKVYDAVYVAQLQSFKRHALASDIKKLIIFSYGGDLPSFCPEVSHAVHNKAFLPPRYVAGGIQQSICGLCLSEVEGQMNAAVEYLLCGIPVVTTSSRGGRDLFFDSSNSLTILPSASHVASAVEYWKESQIDPVAIRSNVLEAVNQWRSILCDYTADIINRYGAEKVYGAVLYSRLFGVPGVINQRMVKHQSIHDPEIMAPFAIEHYSLRVALKPEIRIAEDEEGGVIIEIKTGDMIQLDEVSAAVLNACFRSMSIFDILSLFRSTYPDAPESLEQDILGILKTLFSSQVINVQI